MKRINHAFLIDDDKVTNLINSQVIKLSKITPVITTFENARKALDKLQDLSLSDPDSFPGLIFLDIEMPGMDGWAFLDAFSKFSPHLLHKTSVVILTCSIDLFDIRKAKKYAVVIDYIMKPLDIKALTMVASSKHQYFSISQLAVNAI